MRENRLHFVLPKTTICIAFLCLPSMALWSQENALTNLALAGDYQNFVSSDQWLAFVVNEASQGEDLNQDGDTEDNVLHVHDLESGETTNVGITTFSRVDLSGKWMAYTVGEDQTDLNGDGDTLDNFVFHVRNLETGATTNVGFDARFHNLGFGEFHVSPSWLTFRTREADQGVDLNGDGDTEDTVPIVHELESGETTNVALSSRGSVCLSENWLTFGVDEAGEGADLNGDGDREDLVLHVRDLQMGTNTNLRLPAVCTLSGNWLALNVPEAPGGEDLNGDGDLGDEVIHLHDLSTGETMNLGLASEYTGFFTGRWLVVEVDEVMQGKDLDGDKDNDFFRRGIVHVHELSTGETSNLMFASNAGGNTNGSIQWNGGWSGDLLVFSMFSESGPRTVHVHNIATGETSDTGLQGEVAQVSGDWALLEVREPGAASNDRGMLHVHRLSSGETTNLNVVGSGTIAGDWVALSVSESEQAEDLNGDGDTKDSVVQVLDLSRLDPPRAPTGLFTDVRSLGGAVNSIGSEASPTVTADGLRLFFSSDRPGGEGDWDLYEATRASIDEPFGDVTAEHLGAVNTPFHEGGPHISPDGLTLYATSHRSGKADIWMATRTALNEPFSEAENLGLAAGFPDGVAMGGTTTDGLMLVLDDGAQLSVTTRESASNPFGPPVNLNNYLGDVMINQNDRWFAFEADLSGNGLAIFFSRGFGDIWVTTRTRRDEPFRAPVNLNRFSYGSKINTGFVDINPFISYDWPADGSKLYFTSNRPDGNLFEATWISLTDCVIENGADNPDCNQNGYADDCEILKGVVGDDDGNGIVDDCGPVFLRGECNDDGTIDLSDAVCALDWLFISNATPRCIAALNTNGDREVDLSDAVWLLNFLFTGGPAPAGPFPNCGPGSLEVDNELECSTLAEDCR